MPRRFYPQVAVLTVLVVVVAWAVVTEQLSLNNTSVVDVAQKNLAVEIIPAGSPCPVYGSSVYNLSNTTIAVNWPTIVEPGSAVLNFCLENVGSATSVAFIQGTVSPQPTTPGSLTVSPAGLVAITATGVTSVQTTLTATIGLAPATYTFTLTIS